MLLMRRMMDQPRVAGRERLRCMRAEVVRMILSAMRRLAAGEARARPDNGDGTCQNAAQQGQEHDGEVHRQPFMRLMSSTAIEPRLRKNTTRMARPMAA